MKNAVVELFNKSGMSIREFATRADLKYSTAHDIVTGKAKIENIGAGAFIRIAHVFNKTADELFDEIPQNHKYTDLTSDEQQLIVAYRKCDPNNRGTLLSLAQSLATIPSEADLEYEAMYEEMKREYKEETGHDWEDISIEDIAARYPDDDIDIDL